MWVRDVRRDRCVCVAWVLRALCITELAKAGGIFCMLEKFVVGKWLRQDFGVSFSFLCFDVGLGNLFCADWRNFVCAVFNVK